MRKHLVVACLLLPAIAHGQAISQLPPASAANANDLIPTTQGYTGGGTGVTRAITPSMIISTMMASDVTRALGFAPLAPFQVGAVNGLAGLNASAQLIPQQIPFGTGASTVAQGNDPRITGALQSSAAGPLATQAGASPAAAITAALGAAPYLSTNPASYVPVGTATGTARDAAAAIAAETAAQSTANAAIPSTQKGAANGVASLVGTVVPLAQLPTIPATQLSGLAPSATTDTTNAVNISTGTLAAARIPIGTAANTVAAGNDARIPSGPAGGSSGALVGDALGTASANTSIATGAPTTRTLAARAADIFNARDYGAVGDGTLHTAGATFGITTLAQLCAYAVNGTTPYAFMCSGYPWGTRVNIPIGVLAATGSTTLNFNVTQTTTAAASPAQSPLTTSLPGAVGATTIGIFYGQYLEKTPVGTPLTYNATTNSTVTTTGPLTCTGGFVPGNSCLQPVTALPVAPFGSSGATLQASWRLIMADTTGVEQGDGMACPGGEVQTGTFVEFVNHSTGEVWLSVPSIGLVPASTACTFTRRNILQVSVGAKVFALGVPTGTTVTAVGGNIITISAPTTAPLQPVTPLSSSTAAPDGSLVTFYLPDTDAQAAAESMDFLGTQAAIQAAENTPFGGLVHLTYGPGYEMTQSLVLPAYQQFASGSTPSVGLIGDGRANTQINPTHDFGFQNPAVSCGDPSGTYTNVRGLYASSGDVFCANPAQAGTVGNNIMQGITLRIAGEGSPLFGQLLTIGGVPVMMDGVRAGARLNMIDVAANGFRIPVEAESPDHTVYDRVSTFGFYGFRFGPAGGTLFGDDTFTDDAFSGTWACVAVHPTSYINANIIHLYAASCPYSIYGEPGNTPAANPNGTTNGNSLFTSGTELSGESNLEWAGCGGLYDGNRQTGTGGDFRTISATIMRGDFWSRKTTNELPGGCTWAGYVNAWAWDGGGFENVWANTMAAVSGSPAIVLNRVGDFNGTRGAAGTFTMSGEMAAIIAGQAAINQPVVADSNSGAALSAQGLVNTDGFRRISLVQPGVFVAKPMPVFDAGATTLARGSIMEINAGDTVGLSVQRYAAGGTGTGQLAGINLQPWTTTANGKMTVVAVNGNEAPVQVGATAAIGALLYPPVTASPGVASATGTTPIAQVSNTNGASATQVFGQLLTATGN